MHSQGWPWLILKGIGVLPNPSTESNDNNVQAGHHQQGIIIIANLT